MIVLVVATHFSPSLDLHWVAHRLAAEHADGVVVVQHIEGRDELDTQPEGLALGKRAARLAEEAAALDAELLTRHERMEAIIASFAGEKGLREYAEPPPALRCGWFDRNRRPETLAASSSSNSGRAPQTPVRLHHVNRGDRRKRQHLAHVAGKKW